ncbi:testis-specific serine/threonine-protein kinase 1-like [Oppia nitens]|uniref:testis-specific serine/threonine-protein kinase 1-like n=1 Tax=Oppia nitens TaxID=1686743 RepID=UPI0023D9A9A6|nr:testis-specific serine/threonine-protein kinase 1-like [Oppia nitens]
MSNKTISNETDVKTTTPPLIAKHSDYSEDDRPYSEQSIRQRPLSSLNVMIKNKGYQLKELMGRGHYSLVYRCLWDRSPKMDIACKCIDLDTVDKEWKSKCLKHELIVIRKLKHRHIVRMYDILETPNIVFIFMQWGVNGSIMSLMANQKTAFKENQAKQWFQELTNGLSYMHRKNIAHRDLKLDNFLLDDNYMALLSDFGFSTTAPIGQSLMRQTHCGSPIYMAPEVLTVNKTGKYDAKIADLYSMGVCLYEMITFDKPFTDDISIENLIKEKIKRNYQYNVQINDKLSTDVKDIIYKLLDPNPKHRIKIIDIFNHKALENII